MVDDYLGHHARVMLAIGGNHTAQLRLRTEAGVMVEPIYWDVTHLLWHAVTDFA